MPVPRIDFGSYLRRIGRLTRHEQVILSILAVVIGLIGGGSAIVFREGIEIVHVVAFEMGIDRADPSFVGMPWWRILLATTLGGLLVGLLIEYALPKRRVEGVADVIEASALRGGQMQIRSGLGAAVASALSIGVGASAGREGPVVHLAASLSAFVAEKLRLGRSLSRTLLGCGVAAGVAASFNAPIAGVFFALEVVIGHYALGAFAPVVIASVAGTMVSRAYFGDFPAFIIVGHEIASVFEFPAFALLGLISALTAIVLMRSVALTQKAMREASIPRWTQPACGGLVVGLIAIVYPQVLGVGYAVTDAALNEALVLSVLIGVLIAKTVATAITLGCGFGGGVFSPALVIGAMLGGSFGVIATLVFPDLSSGHGAYTIVGMGAVAGAILGAPISTILMVFELTGDYALTVAVMIATVIASLLTRNIFGHSFFTWQLEQRGLNVREGREQRLLQGVRVGRVMADDFVTVDPGAMMNAVRTKLRSVAYGTLFVIDDERVIHGTITLGDLHQAAFDTEIESLINAQDVARLHPPVLALDADLGMAMSLMQAEEEDHVAVVESLESMKFAGVVHQRDVIMAYRNAIAEAQAEEGSAA